MFYFLLKQYARLVLPLYCVHTKILPPQMLHTKGPVLFAANHPNSFLDGIILTTLCQEKLFSLARGDAFKRPFMNKLLRRLNLLPVYRTSEGVENLEHNYATFKDCLTAFKNDHLVLIFSEGRCENEWHLRPLKKGTARLAISAWQQNIPLQVVPLAFNYASFKRFGKETHLQFGRPITAHHLNWQQPDGKLHLEFNERLRQALAPMVYEIAPQDQATLRRHFPLRKNTRQYVLLPLAAAGWLLQAPLLLACTLLPMLRFRQSGHYDSVQLSLYMLAWPLYTVLLTLLAYQWQPMAGVLMPFVFYILCWVSVREKYAWMG